MENISTPCAPAQPTALALYDQAVAQFAPTGAHWLTYAALLRAEAAQLAGDQARKRIDRAVDCEARALARRTAAAFRAEQGSAS